MATLHERKTEGKLFGGGELISDRLEEIPRMSRYATFDRSAAPPPPSRSGIHSRSASFPQRLSKSPFFVRHNPHPKRVMHLKGLLDVPICTVIDSSSHEDPARFLVKTPLHLGEGSKQFRGLRMPLNSSSFVTCKEKAVPGIGLVPITQTWREELSKLTEAAGLKKRHPILSKTGSLQPPNTSPARLSVTRQGLGATTPLTKNGEVPGTPAGVTNTKPVTRGEHRNLSQERPMEHIISDTEQEGWIMHTLCNILQTDSIMAVQSWLVNAPNREKEIVLDMIRAISTSDHEFREGYNQMAVRSPFYEDQLLQHESSLDLEAIKEYNKTHRSDTRDEEEKYSEKHGNAPSEELPKPRTPVSRNGVRAASEWMASELKPSSTFKERPVTADKEIEEIRSKLESRCSPRVFSHQTRASSSRHSSRATSQQSVYVPPAESLEPVAQRPPSHQSIKSQQSVLKSILEYKPEKEC